MLLSWKALLWRLGDFHDAARGTQYYMAACRVKFQLALLPIQHCVPLQGNTTSKSLTQERSYSTKYELRCHCIAQRGTTWLLAPCRTKTSNLRLQHSYGKCLYGQLGNKALASFTSKTIVMNCSNNAIFLWDYFGLIWNGVPAPNLFF